jgi:hypothetical protein
MLAPTISIADLYVNNTPGLGACWPGPVCAGTGKLTCQSLDILWVLLENRAVIHDKTSCLSFIGPAAKADWIHALTSRLPPLVRRLQAATTGVRRSGLASLT